MAGWRGTSYSWLAELVLKEFDSSFWAVGDDEVGKFRSLHRGRIARKIINVLETGVDEDGDPFYIVKIV